MTERGNEIRIGGDVGGHVVVGDGNSVGEAPAPRAAGRVPRVFLSYRTDDSVHATMAIADRLAREFGQHNVFRDRDALTLGSIYPGNIRRALAGCDIVLAVVGPSWLTLTDASGNRRLDNDRDWVRTELSTALQLHIPVVPVLLDDTPMPERDQLPADIGILPLCTFWQVRHASFDSDVRGLIAGLRTAIPPQG